MWIGYKSCVRACVVCECESIYFFVRELVEEKRINVPFVNSVDNLADFFTKPLDARVFYPMRDGS